MDQYYYTVSSLPFLNIESDSVISFDEFNAICKSTLIDKDFAVLNSISLTNLNDMNTGIPIVEKWISWEGTLRNELARLRAVSLGVESGSYTLEVESNSVAPAIAGTVYKLDSPLKAEESLDMARWQFLDELESGHFFDLEKLIVYSLRLQILERKNMFTKENGNNNFQKIYENIKVAVREA
ncbi:MAG: DUF2764 family protein [Spirochaetia bacterium]|nr:DUF2764 family protein [Spirochaetia bacterium]